MPERKPVALITGASRGLGLEIARLFAQKGMPLIITARGRESLEEAAHELGRLTPVLAIAGDVSDDSHVRSLVSEGIHRFGRIDILINNASSIGLSPMPALESFPLNRFSEVLAVNVVAPLRLIQLLLPQMRERGNGVIINVSSDAAVNAYPGWGGYSASKAALEQLSRVLATELEDSGVRLYTVDPGDMNTLMHQEAEPEADLSHLPAPEAAAAAFLYLVQDETAAFDRIEAPSLDRWFPIEETNGARNRVFA
jgi:NAD(P)-dependent dehydrogenase (short-subunit alcohol dehydrogenase family)